MIEFHAPRTARGAASQVREMAGTSVRELGQPEGTERGEGELGLCGIARLTEETGESRVAIREIRG